MALEKNYLNIGPTSTFKIIIIFMIFNSLYNNYEGFQHFNFIFSQKIISTFKGLFNDEIDIRAMYNTLVCKGFQTQWTTCFAMFYFGKITL